MSARKPQNRTPLGPDDLRHGTWNAYKNLACRCAECKRAAQRRYQTLDLASHPRARSCSVCGTLRLTTKSSSDAVVCRECRRAERARLAEVEARIRAARLAAQAERPARTWRRGSGRSGTGAARYRRLRLEVLAASGICGICGHPGALTLDHIVPAKCWPRGKPGFNEKINMRPAHGTMGNTGAVNRCPTCGKACNQVRGTRAARPLPVMPHAG